MDTPTGINAIFTAEAMSGLQTQLTDGIGAVAPTALVVLGIITAFFLGIKIFKRSAK